MVHALTALRDARSVLYATMNIFMHEPLINWLEPIKMYGVRSEDNEALNYTDSSISSGTI